MQEQEATSPMTPLGLMQGVARLGRISRFERDVQGSGAPGWWMTMNDGTSGPFAVSDHCIAQLLKIPAEDLPMLLTMMPLNVSMENKEDIENRSLGAIKVPTWGESVHPFKFCKYALQARLAYGIS